MNELIERILTEIGIPYGYIFYDGNSETYITYQEVDLSGSYSGDNDILGYISYYDFDVYSNTNYTEIINSLMEKLEKNGFTWQITDSSGDMYETDTKYYHRTLNYAIWRKK